MAEEVNPADLEITDELIAERNDFVPGETPEDMTSWQRPITAAIDIMNNWVGRVIALLLVPLIAIVVWEVTLRNGYAILREKPGTAGFEDWGEKGHALNAWVKITPEGEIILAVKGQGSTRSA